MTAAVPAAFALHDRLAADCIRLGDLPLSTALLMRDDRFPWLILAPRIAGLVDFHDLPPSCVLPLFAEVDRASRALLAHFPVQKINVAALGNQVPQLHVHVIGRRPGDAAWPQPVWSAGPGTADAGVLAGWAATLRRQLGCDDVDHGDQPSEPS